MIRCENNVAGNLENKESIKVLTDTAETISACGKDIQKAAENIMAVCHIPGTKGVAYGNQLLAKVDDLKKLATLYGLASQQLTGAARELANDVPKGEVWN
ncbi:MAG: hypothetical protein V3V70_07595 [Candidatus Scalindua sp.]